MTATTDIIDFKVETPDGATLHAFKEGHGQPLLLVSGLSGSAAFWSDIAATLSRSFQVIRFDQRGIAQRALEVSEVRAGGFTMIDPAPTQW